MTTANNYTTESEESNNVTKANNGSDGEMDLDFDLSPYNSTKWRRVDSAFEMVRRDAEFYMFSASFIIATAIPPNLFLILQVLR